MKSIHRIASIAAPFAAALAIGCVSTLEVGDDAATGSAPATGGSTNSGSGASASGGANVATGGAQASTGGARATGGSSNGGVSSSSGGSGLGGAEPEGGTIAPVLDSSEDCPLGPLQHRSACETPGMMCGYLIDSGNYQECACVRTTTSTAFLCDGFGAANLDQCPERAPEQGSDCFGSIGLICPYPVDLECSCGDSEVWDCPALEPREVSEPPAVPAPSTLVSELSAEERSAWCEWYAMEIVGGPGHAQESDLPVDENGFVEHPGCQVRAEYCMSVIPVLSADQCAANLALSECELPVAMLTDCATVLMSGVCQPSDIVCGEYLAAPGCSGTLISWSPEPPVSGGVNCGVRVQ